MANAVGAARRDALLAAVDPSLLETLKKPIEPAKPLRDADSSDDSDYD